MFGRKAKPAEEPQNDRRQVQRGNVSPAFSYYSSRLAGPARQRIPNRQPQGAEKRSRLSLSLPRGMAANVSLWVFLAIAIVCAVKVLALSNTPKIVVVGKNSTTAGYLQSDGVYVAATQKLLAGSIMNHTKLTVDPGDVSQGLKREFPELLDVSLNIPLVGNRPVVYIQPAVPSLVLQSKHGNYLLNGSGDVLTRARSLPSGVPTIVDQSGLAPHPGRQVLPSGTVAFVRTVAYQFSAAHLTISTFVLPAGSPYELDVRLEGRPYVIRYNLEADALTQSGAAIATVDQLGSTTPANYVDVRVPGRVYYK